MTKLFIPLTAPEQNMETEFYFPSLRPKSERQGNNRIRFRAVRLPDAVKNLSLFPQYIPFGTGSIWQQPFTASWVLAREENPQGVAGRPLQKQKFTWWFRVSPCAAPRVFKERFLKWHGKPLLPLSLIQLALLSHEIDPQQKGRIWSPVVTPT